MHGQFKICLVIVTCGRYVKRSLQFMVSVDFFKFKFAIDKMKKIF
jgi:hypothetical protein